MDEFLEPTFSKKEEEPSFLEPTFGAVSQEDPQAEADQLAPITFTPGESVDSKMDRDTAPSFWEVIGRTDVGKGMGWTPEMLEQRTAIDLVPSVPEEISETVGKYSQAAFESLAGAVPTKPGARTAASAIESGGRLGSSSLEFLSQVYSTLTNSDVQENVLFELGRGVREATQANEEVFGEGNFFTKDLPDAGVTTLGFVMGGGAIRSIGNLPKAMEWAIPALQGAALGGQAGREDAIANGATEEQANLSYWANSVFGAFEAVPVSLAFNRFDKMTEGLVSDKLRKYAQLGIAGVAGALEEALQEGFQTLGGNWIASDIAKYDPDRPLSENLWDAAASGGSVGFLLSLLASSMGMRIRYDKEQERLQLIQQELDKATKELAAKFGVNDLSEIVGDFTPLTEKFFELHQELQEVQKRREEGVISEEEYIAATTKKHEAIDQAGNLFIDSKTYPQLDAQESARHIMNKKLHLVQTNEETEGVSEPILDHLLNNPDKSVVAGVTKYRVQLDNHLAFMQVVKKHIERMEENGLATDEQGNNLDTLKQDLKDAEVKAEILQKQADIETAIAKDLKTIFEDLVKRFYGEQSRKRAPTVKEIQEEHDIRNYRTSVMNETQRLEAIPNPSPEIQQRIKENHREIARIEEELINFRQSQVDVSTPRLIITDQTPQRVGNWGSAITLMKDGTIFYKINMNLDPLMELVRDGKLNSKQMRFIKGMVLEVAMHEFGHTVAFNKITNIFEKANEGRATKEEEDFLRTLLTEYSKWVTDNLNASAGKFNKSYFAPRRLKMFASAFFLTDTEFEKDPTTVRTRFNEGDIEYLFNLDEFLAENAAKYFTQRDEIDPDLVPFFAEALDDYKKIYEANAGRFKVASISWEDFLLEMSLKGKIQKEIERMQKEGPKTIQDTLRDLNKSLEGVGSSGPGTRIFSEEELEKIGADLDKFNQFYNIGANLLYLAEKNPHIQGLQEYINLVRLWKNDVNNTLAIADERLTAWKNLGKDQSEKLARLLYDETLGRKIDGGWLDKPRHFTKEEKAAYGLNEEAIELYNNIKKDFLDSLNRMERVLIDAKRRIFANNKAEMAKEVVKVKREFSALRNKPYFPLMRFGKYVINIRAKHDLNFEGQDYKEGELVVYEAYESKRERDRAYKKLGLEFKKGDYSLSKSALLDPTYSLQGMPVSLIEHMEAHIPNLSKEQKDAFAQIKKDALPFKSFRRQFIRRKKIAGFSLDAQRTYANYMSSFASHIARVQWQQQFQDAMTSVGDSVKIINRMDGGDSTKRSQIFNYMQDHFDYVMNPVNELVALRSAAFTWFLGYNVKSAVVNLTQMPLFTYPYLANAYGDGKALAQMTRAFKTVTTLWKNPEALDKDILEMINRGLAESWLDESLATELALAASEGILERSLPTKGIKRLTQWITHYGALPFHLAEKLNRHITAIAAYRLEKAKGSDHESSIQAARKAVERTQFEYARWNRPRFMRGPIGGTVFIFFNYLQNALTFAIRGDGGSARMLTMLMLFAGIQGLPFGENIMDLYDWMVSWYKKVSGVKDPHTDIRLAMRETLEELNMNPDLILHGLSSSTFGLANIGEYMGWPVPSVDLSGSLSMGRILPFTDLLQPGRAESFEEFVTRGGERAGGAFISGAAGIGRAIFDDNPDQWKRWEKAMPAALRSVSKAARYAVRGGEETQSGVGIADFDMHDTREKMELVLQSLGFTPREVSKGWEEFIAVQQTIRYYESWKGMLLSSFNDAYDMKDDEQKKEVRQRIKEYNRQVPFGEMKITSRSLLDSRRSYQRSHVLNERGIDPQRSYRRLRSEVQDVFESEEVGN